MTTLDSIEGSIDSVLTQFNSGTITFYPYTTGTVDTYKQRTKTFGAGVVLVGRAILNPTPEQLTVIGNAERYDVAFLFSRSEMVRKFPAGEEGHWVDVTGEVAWKNRRFKISKVKPSGQVEDTFLLVIVLGMTIQGDRD